jgi:hypothetical protein
MNKAMQNQEEEHETFISRMKTTIARHQECKGRIRMPDTRRQDKNVSTLIDRMRDAIHHRNKLKKQLNIDTEENSVPDPLARYAHTRVPAFNKAYKEKTQKEEKSKVRKPSLSINTTEWDYDAPMHSPTDSCSFSSLDFSGDYGASACIFEESSRSETQTKLLSS